jgi:hypothetical protein
MVVLHGHRSGPALRGMPARVPHESTSRHILSCRTAGFAPRSGRRLVQQVTHHVRADGGCRSALLGSVAFRSAHQ